jgi:alpha-L-fucosidase
MWYKTIVCGLIVSLSAAVYTAPNACVQAANPAPETKAQRDERLAWWREARFGMFIHWGLYAIPAGEWKGKPIGSIGEWIMNNANIPVQEYEQLAAQFNPVKYDAAEWVRIAKDAGMKYIVITSKHHDGFCLFDTKATSYNVAAASPYGKDLLKPLSEECRKQRLRFCVYYSIMDWHHPAQFPADKDKYNPTQIHADKKAEYMAFMKQQLKELLDTCQPEVLWFDGEWPKWYTPEDGWEIYNFLRAAQPTLIINNRVGTGRSGMEGLDKSDRQYAGDFGTPEQQIPATGLPGVDWESCMTMNDTWGFKRNDQNWKSSENLVRNLIDIASKGGNYLLNVGPTAEGQIPAPSVERLAAMGRWMKANGSSIYGTQASPIDKTPWGRCTQKVFPDGTKRVFFHFFQWPENGRFTLPPLQGTPTRAVLLEGERSQEIQKAGDQTVIRLPQEMPDKVATVLAVDLKPTPRP